MTSDSTSTIPYGLGGRSPQDFNEFGQGYLPGWLGVEVLTADDGRLTARVPIRRQMLGPHGFVHGGTLASIGDTLCGYGTMANLPAGATGFLTIELKINYLGTLSLGEVMAEATPLHVGRTTQVWDCLLSDRATGKRLAVLRCSQMILWTEPGAPARG